MGNLVVVNLPRDFGAGEETGGGAGPTNEAGSSPVKRVRLLTEEMALAAICGSSSNSDGRGVVEPLDDADEDEEDL